MIITKAFLTEKFNEFNAKYFGNEIPMVSFTFSKTRKNLGMYYWKTRTIRITTYYPNITQHDVEEILIHEMVHAWQHATKNVDTGKNCHHGPKFYNKANAVNYLSGHKYHISRLTALSQESKSGLVSTAVDYSHPFLMCKVNENDELWHVGKVTESAKRSFPKWLSNHYSVIESFYVDEAGAELFKGYITSRKRFNYHYLTNKYFDEKVRPHMVNHKEIEVLQAYW